MYNISVTGDLQRCQRLQMNIAMSKGIRAELAAHPLICILHFSIIGYTHMASDKEWNETL